MTPAAEGMDGSTGESAGGHAVVGGVAPASSDCCVGRLVGGKDPVGTRCLTDPESSDRRGDFAPGLAAVRVRVTGND